MPRYGSKYISDPDEKIVSQAQLFINNKNEPNVFPRITTNVEDFRSLLSSEKLLGTDFEFSTKKIAGKEYYSPTIISVSSPDLTVGLRYSEELARECVRYIERGGRFVAHSGLGADKPVLEGPLGIETPLEAWEDSMVVHYYANQALTKTTSKEVSDDAGALGYMGLWTAASLVTDLPAWKSCTGFTCYSSGRVCPTHRPIEYCAVDSWAGLMIYLKQWEKLKSFNFSFDFYRSKMALGEICTRMQNTGLRVDRKYLKELEVTFEEKKESLFNYRLKPKTLKIRKELDRLQLPTDLSLAELKEIQEKLNDVTIDEDDFVREYVDFNPRSSTQILDYFNKNGIDLKKTDKKAVEKVLERLAVEAGYESIHDYAGQEQLSDVALNLYNVWLLKSEGKGTDPWFADKYFNWGQEDVLHPRWLSTGASSARLASSGPNVTNIPRVGFGELIRKAIIPHDPINNELYKADKSQLELRKVLHCAGVSPDALGADAFTWLVEQSGDDFFKAAKEFDVTKYTESPKDAARDIAKKFGHSNSYLIGIDIIPYNKLDSPNVKKKIEAGLLVVYRKKYIPWLEKDWEYCGGIVAFTGVKLAETAYKIVTPETIKKALHMQEEVYFKNDRWGVRKWHMKVLEFIESHGYVQHSCGSFLELFGSPRENAKVAAGYIGQGESAHYMQELMLNYRALGIYPLLQVHDELVFERPRGSSDEEVKEFFRPMRSPSKLFDGFSAPIEIKRGPNWKDLKLVGKI